MKIEQKNNGRCRRSHSPSTSRKSKSKSQSISKPKPKSKFTSKSESPLSLNPFAPNAPQALERLCMPQLNWSYFKFKYSGKPDKDAEAHILKMNDWMDMYEFPNHVKVQRFCLTLAGDNRWWYESLRLINADWVGLQNILGSNIPR